MSELGFGNITDNLFLSIFYGTKDETTDNTDSVLEPGGSVEMKVLSCNIQNTPNLPRSKVIASAKAVSGKFTVGGFQEIAESNDTADLRTGLGHSYSLVAHTQHRWASTPIAYRRDRFKLIDSGFVLGSEYVKGMGPGRGFEWVLLENLASGMRQYFVSTHMTVAFSHNPRQQEPIRKEMWERHYGIMRGFCLSKKYPVWIVGDFNRRDVKRFSANHHWLDGDGRIDKIGIILPPGYRTKMTGPNFSINTPSDHDAKGVQRRIIKEK